MMKLFWPLAGSVVFALALFPAMAQNYELLEKKTETEKKELLRSAINMRGHPCQDVTNFLFKGSDKEDGGYWAAACSDGGNWLIHIENDASATTRVMPCGFAEQLGIECWEKF